MTAAARGIRKFRSAASPQCFHAEPSATFHAENPLSVKAETDRPTRRAVTHVGPCVASLMAGTHCPCLRTMFTARAHGYGVPALIGTFVTLTATSRTTDRVSVTLIVCSFDCSTQQTGRNERSILRRFGADASLFVDCTTDVPTPDVRRERVFFGRDGSGPSNFHSARPGFSCIHVT